MTRKLFLANAVLWAAAILSAALLGAPQMLTVILLPTLAACALISNREEMVRDACTLRRRFRE